MLTKTQIKQMQELMKPDYIPNGKSRIYLGDLKFRRTQEHEVCRCAAMTGDDIQSGPIYCGKLAEWIHECEDGSFIASCDKHTPKRNREEE